MKAKLLTLCLMVAALLSAGCTASVRYNRGYYGPGYRYDRDRGRYEQYRDHRHDNRRDRRDYRYDDRRY